MKRLSIIFTTLWAVIFCILGVFVVYVGDFYHATREVSAEAGVEITDKGDYIFFDGDKDDKALIFYQGAKVDEAAYAPLMAGLAKKGVDCFLVKMPYELAVLGANRADGIMQEHCYDKWYLAGHSLGGAMAEAYAAEHTEQIDGLMLLAAYGTKDISSSSLSVRVIYGSEDGVLNRDKLVECRANMPDDYDEIVIEGANHAGFGCYGEQKGDMPASISGDEQIEKTIQIIVDNM